MLIDFDNRPPKPLMFSFGYANSIEFFDVVLCS